MPPTHYSILDIRQNASRGDIEQAYRLLVRKCHPDLNTDDSAARERFQQVQAAFDVLHNAESRRQYDLSLENADARPSNGSFELFAESAAGKSGEPIVSVADENDMDHVRFRVMVPRTALLLWRPRSRLVSIQDWLLSSDFVLPLFVLLIYLGIQVVGKVLTFGD